MEYQTKIKELQKDLAELHSSYFVDALKLEGFKQGSAVNKFCKEVQAREHGKKIVVLRAKVEGSAASGGRSTVLCCSQRLQGCAFMITCSKGRGEDETFKVIEAKTNLVHGGASPDSGELMVCTSVCTPSAKEVSCDPVYLAHMGKLHSRTRKGSIKVVKSSYAVHNGVAAPTTDVIKKANAMSKISVVELVESYNYILPFCEIAKEMNNDFCYDIRKDSGNRINKMAVLFAHCKQMFQYCFPLLGLDTAHLPILKLKGITADLLEKIGRSDLVEGPGYVLRKMSLTFLTGRTANNEMIVFGYMIHHVECADDIKYFLMFMRDSGLDINHKRMTILTDRGLSFPGPIREILPLSLHCLCAVHLKRNLCSNVPGCTPGEISQYWRVRGATTHHKYKEEMAVLNSMPHGPACVKYLSEVEGVWQLYKVIQKGNIIHEVKSDNIVEATFGVHLEERHDPSLFVFLQELYSRGCERMNKMKQEIGDLDPQECLVPVAKARFDLNVLYAKTCGCDVSYSSTDPNKLCGTVSKYMGTPPRLVRYNVNFLKRTCDCRHWEQSGVPCYHAIALLLQYNPRRGGPLSCLSVYFYDWCLAEPYRKMLENTLLQVPHLPDVIDRARTDPEKYSIFPRVTVNADATTSTKRIASQGDTASGGGLSRSALAKLGKKKCLHCGAVRSIGTKHPSSACLKVIGRAIKQNNAGNTFMNTPYLVMNTIIHPAFVDPAPDLP